MFGVIVSGRTVVTAFEKISDTQISFSIPSIPVFHHLVVFLLPGASLPPDAAAAVYIQTPPSTEFKLLGALSNEKQSAIFKIRNTSQHVGGIGVMDQDAMSDGTLVPATANEVITLGISLEPTAQVEANLAALNAVQATPTTGLELVKSPRLSGPPADTKVLAQKIIANAFNFLSSFGSETIPLKAFQEWWKKFEKKVEMDPGFLERETG